MSCRCSFNGTEIERRGENCCTRHVRYAGVAATCIFIVASFEDIFLDDISVYTRTPIDTRITHTRIHTYRHVYTDTKEHSASIFRPVPLSFSSRDRKPPNLDRTRLFLFHASRINVRCLFHPDRAFLLFYILLTL